MSAEKECDSRLDWKLLKQGAEARVYSCMYLGKPAVVKERFVKTYRLPELDKKLTHRSPLFPCLPIYLSFSIFTSLYTILDVYIHILLAFTFL